MAEIVGTPTVELTLTLELNESEARALDAIVGYGDDSFLRVFYEHLGKAYLAKHEHGLRLLFKTARDKIPAWLSRADEARAVFSGKKIAVYQTKEPPHD